MAKQTMSMSGERFAKNSKTSSIDLVEGTQHAQTPHELTLAPNKSIPHEGTSMHTNKIDADGPEIHLDPPSQDDKVPAHAETIDHQSSAVRI